jgi:hypothetical protein
MRIVTRTWGWALAAVASLAMAAPAGAQHAHDEAVPAPAVGDVVAPFDAQSVDGSVQKVAFNGRGSTVLLFFLSSCPTCHRMIPEWNRAFQRKPAGLQVYGVILDKEPPTFFQSYPMAFPVVRSPGREFQQKIKVTRTPTMVRIGPGGKVQDVVVGYTDPIRVGEIFRP